MKSIQMVVDHVLDVISPGWYTEVLGNKMDRSMARFLYPKIRHVIRVMLLLCELVLMMTLVSCSGDLYKGTDIIRETFTLQVTMLHHWGAFALTLVSFLALAALLFAVFSKTPFELLYRITSYNAVLMIAAAAYYRICEDYIYSRYTIGEVYLKAGAYELVWIYVLTMAAALLGRACELSLKMGVLRRKPLYQSRWYFPALAAVLLDTAAAALLSFTMKSADQEYFLVLLALDVALVLLTLIRSNHAGGFAALKCGYAGCLIYFYCSDTSWEDWKTTAVYGCCLLTTLAAVIVMHVSEKENGETVLVKASQSSPEITFCSTCGTRIEGPARFCPNCGKQIDLH